jgi:hypothetical protein
MKVLLAVDGSPHSQLAVAAVVERPWPDGTIVEVLTVIHAVAPLAIDPAFVMAAAHVDQIAEQRHLSSAVVESAMKEIRKNAPGLTVSTKVVEGNPKDAILEESREGCRSHRRRLSRLWSSEANGAWFSSRRRCRQRPCSVHVAREKHDVEHAAA